MSASTENETLTGTWRNGQVVLDEPADWPEGARITLTPERQDVPPFGMREEDWSDTPEAIAEWLDWYDNLEPLEMTPEEEARWQEARAAQKAYEIATFEERAKRIEGLFP